MFLGLPRVLQLRKIITMTYKKTRNYAINVFDVLLSSGVFKTSITFCTGLISLQSMCTKLVFC